MNKLYRSAIFLILIITIFAVSGCSGKSAAVIQRRLVEK
jgi:hypothetical protein